MKMIKLGGLTAGLMLVLSLVASSAQATTVCVQPQGGVCAGDIRSGIETLQFGDTVRVRPGIYTDTIQFPTLKAGIRLIGSAGVILDARSDGVAQFQPSPGGNNPVNPPIVPLNQDVGIHIYTNDVQLVGFTILDGISDAVLIEPGFDDTRIISLRILNPAGVGIRAPNSNDTVIQNVEFIGAQGGIEIGGDDNVIDRVMVTGSDGPGIVVTGNNVFVSRSTVSRIVNGGGIFVTGDDAW
jgi:hypothetical protein